MNNTTKEITIEEKLIASLEKRLGLKSGEFNKSDSETIETLIENKNKIKLQPQRNRNFIFSRGSVYLALNKLTSRREIEKQHDRI